MLVEYQDHSTQVSSWENTRTKVSTLVIKKKEKEQTGRLHEVLCQPMMFKRNEKRHGIVNLMNHQSTFIITGYLVPLGAGIQLLELRKAY